LTVDYSANNSCNACNVILWLLQLYGIQTVFQSPSFKIIFI